MRLTVTLVKDSDCPAVHVEADRTLTDKEKRWITNALSSYDKDVVVTWGEMPPYRLVILPSYFLLSEPQMRGYSAKVADALGISASKIVYL